MEALDVSATFEGFCNLLPVASPVNFDSLGELLIFSLGPVAFSGAVLVLSRTGFVKVGVGSLLSKDDLFNLLGQLLKRVRIQILTLVSIELKSEALSGVFCKNFWSSFETSESLAILKDSLMRCFCCM